MKRLVCEMCGGTDLVKQDGVFVCQNCGTKYSVEEAKKMMVEGAVTVEGTVAVEGTVKVDKSEQLKKLYILAERARKSNNSDNAVRYYNEIMFEDPNSWEANFYLVYFKAKNTNVGSIPSVCYDLINNYQSTFELLVQDKGEDIVAELNMLLDDIKRYCITIINSTRGMQEDCMYWSKALDCLSSYGDKLVESYGDKYKDVAIKSWKETLDLYVQIINSCESEGLAESTADLIMYYFDINAVIEKIYNFDFTYEDPWGYTEDLRRDEKFLNCPKCGTKMRERDSKCPQCGTPKEEIQRLIKEQAEREAAERERIRKEREAQEAEEARIRAEKRAEWWAANKKKVIVTTVTIIALLVGVIVYHKMAENKRYQQALAEAKAYIASGDSCVAIYQFEEAQEFYDKAKHTEARETVYKEVWNKESALREAQAKSKKKAEKEEIEQQQETIQYTEEHVNSKPQETSTSDVKYIVPMGTKKIDSWAFEGRKDIKEVVIPNSVIEIGEYAFHDCTSLTSVTIGEGVKQIGYCAFSGCANLKSIYIPASVNNIEAYVFNRCDNICSITVDTRNSTYDSRNNSNAIIETSSNTLVVGCKKTIIPEGVKIIGKSAFANCQHLTNVEIPKSVTKILEQAFYGCKDLKTIYFSEGLQSIEKNAFKECHSLASITLPNTLSSTGEGAFSSCENLESVVMGKGIVNVGMWTFGHCSSLSNVTIPEGATIDIDPWAFSYCSSLTIIKLPRSTKATSANAFTDCPLLEVQVPDYCRGKIKFSGVKKITYY